MGSRDDPAMLPIDVSWLRDLLTAGAGLGVYKTVWRFLQPWEITRLATAQVEADIIKAKGAVEVASVEAVGEARLAGLRARLESPPSAHRQLAPAGDHTAITVHAEPDPFVTASDFATRLMNAESIGDRVLARLVFEQLTAQGNLDSVIRTMLSLPRPAGDPGGREPNEAWKNKFSSVAGAYATDEETRTLYAKLLAGEIVQPGRFSLKTLEMVENLSSEDVRIFESIIPFTLDDGVILGDGNVFFSSSGITYDQILRMDEVGLVHPNLAFVINTGLRELSSHRQGEHAWESTIGMLDKQFVIRRQVGGYAYATEQWQTPAHLMTRAGSELRSNSMNIAPAPRS